MSRIFSGPSMPAIPEPIKPPTTDDARQAEEDMMRLRRRRGLASTFLAGRVSRAGSAAETLLGAGSTMAAATAPTAGSGAGGGGRAPAGRTMTR